MEPIRERGPEGRSVRRHLLALRRRERRRDGERAYLGRQLGGGKAGAGLGPVLGRELEVALPGPMGQDAEGVAQVLLGLNRCSRADVTGEPQETFMRCWGHTTPAESKGMQFERSDCVMDNAIFVSGSVRTGSVSVRHEEYDGRRLGALRFAQQYSASFRNEAFGESDKARTAPQCQERDVDRGGLPLHAVLCLRAYRKLRGIYDLSVLVATLDQTQSGAQGRMDVSGVSFENALKLADFYLQGFGWKSDAR